jgi:HemK-related putative methylase
MIQINYKDYHLSIPKEIYLPSEDTYLLIETLLKDLNKEKKSFLEIGPGSGVITFEMYAFFEKLTAVDLDPKVVNYLKEVKEKYALQKLEVLQSDLFSKVSSNTFDVIIFNPPYVPSEEIEVLSTDGGKEGSEVILKFIRCLKKHLNKNGCSYLLLSSHNNLEKIFLTIKEEKMSYIILSEKNIFFEKLIVIKISDL